MTEAARDVTREGFVSGLFMGDLDFPALHPFPAQTAADREQGGGFLEKLEGFLREHADPDEIDRTGEIPQSVFDGLAKLGAFGI